MRGIESLLDGAFIKTTVALGTAGTVFQFSPEFTVDYIGVPFNVLIACMAGAYSGFSFGDRIAPRSKMFQLFVACVIMGSAWTAVLDGAVRHFTAWEFQRGALAGLGAIVSCMTRFFIPELIKRIGPWLDRIPFLSSKKPPGE